MAGSAATAALSARGRGARRAAQSPPRRSGSRRAQTGSLAARAERASAGRVARASRRSVESFDGAQDSILSGVEWVEQVLCGACCEKCGTQFVRRWHAPGRAGQDHQEIQRRGEPMLVAPHDLPEPPLRAVPVTALEAPAATAHDDRSAALTRGRAPAPERERLAPGHASPPEDLRDRRRRKTAFLQQNLSDDEPVAALVPTTSQHQPSSARAHPGAEAVAAFSLQVGDGPEMKLHAGITWHYRGGTPAASSGVEKKLAGGTGRLL